MTPRPKGLTPTLAQIRAASEFGKRYFSRETLRFFGQSARDFAVEWSPEKGAWKTTGIWRCPGGNGVSSHYWEAGTLRPVEE